MTCTSDLYPLGNSGRIGRSVRRAARVAASVGRPSRLMNPPGILPGGVHSLFVIDGQREEAHRCVRLPLADDSREDSRVAVADDDRAVSLLGDQTGFKRQRAACEFHFHAGYGGTIIAGHHVFLSIGVKCVSFSTMIAAKDQSAALRNWSLLTERTGQTPIPHAVRAPSRAIAELSR